jgi:amino acid permease
MSRRTWFLIRVSLNSVFMIFGCALIVMIVLLMPEYLAKHPEYGIPERAASSLALFVFFIVPCLYLVASSSKRILKLWRNEKKCLKNVKRCS